MELNLQLFEKFVLEEFRTKVKKNLEPTSCTVVVCRAKTNKGHPCTAPGKFDGFCGKHKKENTNQQRLYSENIIYHIGHLPNEFCSNCPRCQLQVT